jgi:hypothetical protein
VNTNAPQHTGERHLFPHDSQRLLELALTGQVDVQRHVDVRRTGVLAGDGYLFPVEVGIIGGCGIHQGTHRAHLDAGTAEAATRVLKGPVKGGADHRIEAASGKTDSPDTPDLSAHLHTAATENTEVVVAPDERLAVIVGGQSFVFIR